jgi:hypothetical protein
VKAGCHNSNGFVITPYATLMAGKSLSTGTSYVVPGNPAGSYLCQKCDPAKYPGSVGGNMGGAGYGNLTAAQLSAVETWVQQGAKP